MKQSNIRIKIYISRCALDVVNKFKITIYLYIENIFIDLHTSLIIHKNINLYLLFLSKRIDVFIKRVLCQ